MKVRYELVDEYEKCPAEKKTYDGGQKTQRAVCFFCTLDRRNEQRPYGRRHHDSRSKPQKQSIEFAGHLSLEEKYKRRARSRRYENDTKTEYGHCSRRQICPPFVPLLLSDQQFGMREHICPALFLGQKQAVRRINKFDLLKAALFQLFHKRPHIAVFARLHDVVNGECAALFQYAQRLQKKSLFILTLDVVIDVVARHGVERFVRKVEFYGDRKSVV